MNNWISVKDRLPEVQTECLVYRKWPGEDEFSIDIDRLEPDSTMEGGGFWQVEENHVDWAEAVSGRCERPVTTHWQPMPASPVEVK